MKKVITYGTYDLFHEGHYNLLKRAKALGDYLIVGVTTEYYDLQRGKLNVVNSVLERVENVKKTGLADEIIIEDHDGQKPEDIQKMNVDIFAIGSDWVGTFDYLKEFCEVVYLERTPDISSTMIRASKYPIQQVGIVGTGRIAPRFLAEAKFVSGINARAAYNPNQESVREFGKNHELEVYWKDFSEFLGRVDALYIASPHETHYYYAKQAIEKGRHVLCEKPLCLSKVQSEELFRYAQQKDCILFEGIKTAYCPGFIKLLGIACSGMIGSIRGVEACFTKLEDVSNRELKDTKYGGSFTELGSYCLLPIIKLFGNSYKSVKFDVVTNEDGIDIYTKAYIRYQNGLATATCGLGVKSEGKLLISGTKGYIVVEPPWWKTSYFEVHHENPQDVERFSDRFLGDGLRYEICDMLSMINGDTRKDYKLTRKDSETMAGIMEQFLMTRGE